MQMIYIFSKPISMDILPNKLSQSIASFLRESNDTYLSHTYYVLQGSVYIETIYEKHKNFINITLQNNILSKLKYINYDNVIEIRDNKLLSDVKFISNNLQLNSQNSHILDKFY